MAAARTIDNTSYTSESRLLPTVIAMEQSEKDTDLNYFICTLSQAAAINKENPHPFKTINEFIDHQAEQFPTRPAVGFPLPRKNADEQWGQAVYTFDDLRQISYSTIVSLRGWRSRTSRDKSETVALLCPNSINFLFYWLALMRLGYSVLLVAPQCQPSAIVHLCRMCDVRTLFFDHAHMGLSKETERLAKLQSEEWELNLEPLINVEENKHTPDKSPKSLHDEHVHDIQTWSASENDIAYLHHTSGTSTGLAKPIPQSHRAAVGVLPTFTRGHDKATFSTTPLYHGGIADCFRAWTSGSMIWLFPGAEIPITSSNIIKCLNCTTSSLQTPKVAYFSSVPYVLQMMAADNEGLKRLRRMELVGFGGAALPPNVGDDMVEAGVNLLSRFGSAECGFLMTSHRNYASDKEWQCLRSRASPHLKFEPRPGGLAELVVLLKWPHKAKTNRPDGSYTTSDLFELHPTIPDAWKYHSRADSQLTLLTGKKFDPAPLEAAIATSSLLSDVLLFGNGRQYPGALLFRSPASVDLTNEAILNTLWPSIEELNVGSQGHARLSKPMLVIMPKDILGLEKSSKGTTMRSQAEIIYANYINEAYDGGLQPPMDSLPYRARDRFVPDDEVPVTVLQIVKDVVKTQEAISEDADLFSYGVDSVGSMQIRALLQRKFLPYDAARLPLNVVYDCGSIKELSNNIIRLRRGQVMEQEDEIKLMQSLVRHYSIFPFSPEIDSLPQQSNPSCSLAESNREIVILTGATGALGAHILSGLLASSQVLKVHCLVRAASQTAAEERVSKSLRARNRQSLDISSSKLDCHPFKLSDSRLGLDEALYVDLAMRATIIIHAAWAVNFSMRLSSFVKEHIAGLENLIDFAIFPASLPPRFLFCSSTASVLGPNTVSPIPESISKDPLFASPLGYSRSKWVAEAICEQAYYRTRLHDNIAVLRIGQLCGDTANGIWNITEAWPLMLSSLKVTKSLPNLQSEKLDWLPVDIAAHAVLQIALPLTDQPLGTTEQDISEHYMPNTADQSIPVYHILNPSAETTWSDLLDWLQMLSPGIDVVPPADWVAQLEHFKDDDANHPATKLLGLWKEAYCRNNSIVQAKEDIVFEMNETKRVASTMRIVKPIDQAQFEKMWRWIEQEMASKIE